MDNTFRCGLELIKATILGLNMPGVDLNGWVFPTPIIEPEDYLGVFMDGAWAMAYNQYCEWHKKLAYPPSDLLD